MMPLQKLRATTRLRICELLHELRTVLPRAQDERPVQPLDLFQLEERILLSASPVAVTAEAIDAALLDNGPAGPTGSASVDSGSASLLDQMLSSQTASTSTGRTSVDDVAASAADVTQVTLRELVFLDTGVENYEQLLEDLRFLDNRTREIEVVLLSDQRDGVDQITEALSGRTDIDAIHIVSHGTDRAVKLGSTWLTADTLAGYVGAIGSWGGSLSTNADLLFYGCDLAASSEGQELVDSISVLTGADVAASTDDTGNAIFGADWELEYFTGQIETQIAFSEDAQDNWFQLLNITVNSTSTAATAGSQNSLTFSHTVNSGTDRVLTVGLSLVSGQSTGVTFGGTAMTLVGRHSGTHTIEFWQLVNPSVTTASVVASFSGSLQAIGGAVTYDGVDQTTPTGTFQGAGGDSATASVTIASAPGEFVIDAVFAAVSLTATPGAGQTQNWHQTNGHTGAGSCEAGAASVTMSWGLSTSEEWDIAATTLKTAQANVAPVLTTTAANLAYVENDAATAIDASLTISDDDSTNITGATVTVSANYVNGEDVLAFTNQLGITGNFDAGTGVLTLSGTTTIANYQTALRTVTYQNTSETPSTLPRTVSFAVSDGIDTSVAGVQTTLLSSDFSADADGFVYADDTFGTSDPSKATGSYQSALGLTDGGLRVFLGPGANAADVSGGFLKDFTLSEAGEVVVSLDFRMWMGEGYETDEYGEVVLTIDGTRYGADTNTSLLHVIGNNNGGGTDDSGWLAGEVRVTLSAGVHTLTLGAYNNKATAGDEFVEVVFDNVLVAETSSDKTVTVAAVNDKPSIENLAGDSPSYIEGDGAVVIEQGGNASVTDVDSLDFDTGNLTVSIVSGGVGTEDVLSIRNEGTGSGQIGFSAGNVTYAGTLIGTATGGTSGSPLVITLNTNADATSLTALIRNVTYENTNTDNPTAGAKTIRTTLNDGDGGTSNGSDVSLTVSGDNDAPIVTTTGSTVSYTEDDAATVIDAALTVSDVDSTNLTGAVVSITTAFSFGEDVLAFSDQLGITGGFNASTGLLTLTGTTTVANYQTALRTVTYENTSDAPSTTTRTISFFADDGVDSSVAATRNVSIAAENDAPVATADPGDYAADLLALNPLSYWRLGESSGTSASDAGSLSNAGTYNGTTLAQTGAINGDSNTAVRFNGTSDYVEFAHDASYLLDNGTIQLWFNADAASTGTEQHLFSKDSSGFDTGGHISLYLTTTGRVEVRLQSTTTDYFVQTASPVSSTAWHHVAVSFGDNGLQLFVDGQLADIEAYTGGLATTSGGTGNANPIAVGAGTQNSDDNIITPVNEFFGGLIDEVAILGSQLSADTIQDLYAAGLQNYQIVHSNTLTVTTAEGVLANDFDEEGDSLTATVVTGPSNAASFTLNPDGSFDYTPTAGFSGTDSFTYKTNDGTTDGNSTTVTLTVTNQAPVITLPGSVVSFDEGDAATIIDGTATVSDADSTDFDTGTLTVEFTANGTTNDRLAIRNEGTGTGQIGVSGSNVTYEGTTIGTFAGGTDGSTPLVITFNASSTPAASQTLMRNVTFENFSDNPSELNRTVRFVLTDGDGDTSNAATQTVSVTATNDDPTGSGSLTATSLNDNAGATYLFGGLSVTDVDTGEADLSLTITLTTPTAGTIPGGGFTETAPGSGIYTVSGLTTATADTALDNAQFTPTDNTSPSGTFNTDFSVTVNDQGGGGEQTVLAATTVTITRVNDAPIVTSNGGTGTAAVNVAENSTVVTTVTSTDIDGGTPSYSISGGADAARFLINSSSGELTFVTGPDFEAPTDADTDNIYEVTVQVSDGASGTDTQAISVTVTSLNDNTPVITSNGGGASSAVNVAENSTAVTAVTATDADLPTQTLTYTITGGVDAARFAIDSSSGTLTFALAPNSESPTDADTDNIYEVTVEASDDLGGTDMQAISVTVTDVDEFDVTAPADVDGAADAVDENAANGTTVGVTASASDADATTNGITYSLFDDAGGRFTIDGVTGIVTVADGTQLDREAAASHDITVRATSDDGSTEDMTFTIALNPINDNAPAINSNGGGATTDVNVAENSNTVATATATDADLPAQALIYSLSGTDAARFNIDSASGVLTFAAAPNYEVPADADSDNVYDVTVTVSDGDGGTDSQIVTVTLTDVDEFDITSVSDADADPESVAENLSIGSPVGIKAFADDFDGTDSVIYSLDDTAGGRFRIDPTGGVVTTDAVLDAETATAHSITVRATSTDGSTTARDFTISIVDVDEFDTSPVNDVDATADGLDENATIGTAVGVTAFARDNDVTSSVLYSLDSDADGLLTIDPLTGVVVVADEIDFEVTPNLDITIRVTSTDGSFSTLGVTVPVGDLNDNLPVVTPGQVFRVSEFATNLTVVGTALATDVDTVGTIQNWAITGGNGDGVFSIDPVTGMLRVADNSTVNFEVTAGYTLTLIVEDGSNVSVLQSVTVNVIDENDLPVLTTNEVSAVVEGSSVAITSAFLEVSDEDDLPAENIYIVSTPPSVGRLELTTGPGTAIGSFTQDDIDNGRLVYVHDGSESDDLFTFMVSDGSGGAISATDHLIIASRVNDAPVNSMPGTQSTDEDTSLVFSTANANRISISDDDVFGDLLGVRLTSTNGTLTLSGTTGLTFALGTGAGDLLVVFAGSIVDINAALDGLRFEPDENYNGPATVRVEVRDFGSSGSGGERADGDTVNIVVRSVNDAPVSFDDEYTVRQLSTLKVSAVDGLSANDQDVESDSLNAIVVDEPAHGTLVLNPDGSLTYVPDPIFFGRDTFTYLVTDGSANSEVAEVEITVQQTVSSDSGSGGADGGSNGGGGGGDGSGDGTEDGTLVGIPPGTPGVDPVTGTPGPGDDPNTDQDEIVGVDPSTLTTPPTDSPSDEDSDDDSTRDAELASSARRMRDRQDSEKNPDDVMNAAPLRTWSSELPDLPEDSIVQVLAQAGLWTELDQFEKSVARTEAAEINLTDLVVGTTSVAGTSLTLGYVIWLLRSGSILVSLVSSLPAWTMMDPLPVLEDALAASGDDEDDSLQSLLNDYSDES